MTVGLVVRWISSMSRVTCTTEQLRRLPDCGAGSSAALPTAILVGSYRSGSHGTIPRVCPVALTYGSSRSSHRLLLHSASCCACPPSHPQRRRLHQLPQWTIRLLSLAFGCSPPHQQRRLLSLEGATAVCRSMCQLTLQSAPRHLRGLHVCITVAAPLSQHRTRRLLALLWDLDLRLQLCQLPCSPHVPDAVEHGLQAGALQLSHSLRGWPSALPTSYVVGPCIDAALWLVPPCSFSHSVRPSATFAGGVRVQPCAPVADHERCHTMWATMLRRVSSASA